MTASVYGRHAHVFWIPLFPIGKTGIFECQHCHKGFKKKELGEDGKREYKNFLTDVKAPLWKYSGLGIIGLFVAWGFYSSKMNDDKVAELVEKPAMYDKYIYKTEGNNYSTFKIIEVFKDSIYVDWNDYGVHKQSAVDEIDTEENYPGDIYVLSTTEVKAMFDSGDIKAIECE